MTAKGLGLLDDGRWRGGCALDLSLVCVTLYTTMMMLSSPEIRSTHHNI